MNILKASTLLLATGIVALTSCKKKEPELRDEKVGGCTDSDSPFYNKDADFEDESCVYAYLDVYEITYYASQKPGGGDWDGGLTLPAYRDADLMFSFKEKDASTWIFESSVFEDVPSNQVTTWTSPTSFKLLNRDYEWILVDDDVSGSETIASGTFNPIELADNGEIVVLDNVSVSGNPTQLILHYSVGE